MTYHPLVLMTLPKPDPATTAAVTPLSMATRTAGRLGARVVTRLLANQLLEAAFQGILGRAPDAEGREYWLHRLRNGTPWAAMLQELTTSDEFRSQDRVSDDPMSLLSRDARILLRAATPNGISLRLLARLGDQSFVSEFAHGGNTWEAALTSFVEHQLRPGDVFVDGGANLGWYTLVGAASVQPFGRVISFEPGHAARELLAENCQLNDISAEIVPLALWSHAERLALSVAEAGLGYAHISPTGREEDMIDCVGLDDWAAESDIDLARLSLIKLDIEGAEPQALAGMRRILTAHRPTVALEVNSHCLRRLGNSPLGIWHPLREAGYSIYVLAGTQGASAFSDLPRRVLNGGDGYEVLEGGEFLERISAADAAVDAPAAVIEVVATAS